MHYLFFSFEITMPDWATLPAWAIGPRTAFMTSTHELSQTASTSHQNQVWFKGTGLHAIQDFIVKPFRLTMNRIKTNVTRTLKIICHKMIAKQLKK